MKRNKHFCRRRIIAFCILLSGVHAAMAQKNIAISPVKNIGTGKSSVINMISSCIATPFVYYFTNEEWNSENRRLKIYSVNTTNERRDSFEITLPASITINDLPEISVSDNYLLLCDDEHFDFYRFIKSNGKFIFSNKIDLPKKACGRYMKALGNDKFLLYTIYNFHPADKRNNANIGIYDAKNDKILKFIHPEVPCIGFSHLTKSWVTTSDKYIALANPCGYKIRLYDFNLNVVDSIDYTGAVDWNNLPGNKIPVETDPSKIHPKLLIDQLLLMQDTISRIEKISFINDSQLLVSSTCKNCGNEKRRIDVWMLNKWEKPYLTIPSFPVSYSVNDTIDIENAPLMLYHATKSEANDNLIIQVRDDDFYPKQNIPVKEFNHLKDLYYEKNDPQFSIAVYRININ